MLKVLRALRVPATMIHLVADVARAIGRVLNIPGR